LAAIRVAAALTVQSETLQAAIVRGERGAEEELTRALNAQARALRELRLMQKRCSSRSAGRHELDAIADGRQMSNVPAISVSDAMATPLLFGPFFRGPSWDTWRAVDQPINMFEVFRRCIVDRWRRIGTAQCANGHKYGAG
jgi:hypothetical protein